MTQMITMSLSLATAKGELRSSAPLATRSSTCTRLAADTRGTCLVVAVLAFGPFYAFAIYAFVKGRDWIRLPAVMWAGTMVANVSIIMLEEWHGEGPPTVPRDREHRS